MLVFIMVHNQWSHETIVLSNNEFLERTRLIVHRLALGSYSHQTIPFESESCSPCPIITKRGVCVETNANAIIIVRESI